MTTRRVDLLIRKIRNETGNQDYGPSSGISDTQICDYINDGVAFLQRGINQVHAEHFCNQKLMSTVAGQEAYDLPDDYLQSGGVVMVEFSLAGSSASDPNWKKLEEITSLERSSGARSDTPSGYIVRNKQILLRSIPSVSRTDVLRVTYAKQLTRLDIRRGTVDVATLNSGASSITTLSIDIATALDPNEFDQNEYISVVDADGVQKMKGIPITGAYNTSTGNITVRSGFTYDSGETIAVGDYIVFGRDASTHQIMLDESVESFLVSFASWKVMREDSNTDSAEQLTEFKGQRDDILSAFARPSQGINLVPEV